MRKSKKNLVIKKRNKTKKFRCIVTDEVKRIRAAIKYLKTKRTTKKNKTT